MVCRLSVHACVALTRQVMVVMHVVVAASGHAVKVSGDREEVNRAARKVQRRERHRAEKSHPNCFRGRL